jgi:hypothetical protein
MSDRPRHCCAAVANWPRTSTRIGLLGSSVRRLIARRQIFAMLRAHKATLAQ